MDGILQLAAYLPHSRVNGPGLRSVVWVQGCSLRCAGCFNPDFLPQEGGTPTHIEDLIARLLAEKETEGVTFSGGEPFDQAQALFKVATACREAGKGIVIFTGYELAFLSHSEDSHRKALLAASDLLVAGPYQRGNPGRHPLLSSGNQELVFLSDRYRDYDFGAPRRRIEYRIQGNTMITTGFPKP